MKSVKRNFSLWILLILLWWNLAPVHAMGLSPTITHAASKFSTANVTINVSFSCDSTSPDYTFVKLTSTSVPDTFRTAVLNGTSSVTFNNLWAGEYNLNVSHFEYEPFDQDIMIINDTTVQVELMEMRTPIYGLQIDNYILRAQWEAPIYSASNFTEDWSGGSFITNNWTAEGSNWIISGTGNPGPCAEFSGSPEQLNYEFSLTSETLSGTHSPEMWLVFDITLSNVGNTAVNYLAIELWNGSTWNTLQTFDNSSGASFNWTTFSEYISSMTNGTFKIRFRAYGENSSYINYWGIDNIKIVGSTGYEKNPCIIGYDFYINNIMAGFTPDTFYNIPPADAPYGDTCTACVEALYGSGPSTMICKNFISHFLCPPANLEAQMLENVVHLTWEKPNCFSVPPPNNPDLLGYKVYRNNYLLASIGDADSLEYFDINPSPHFYCYSVTAKYDLTAFGGGTSESYESNNACVDVGGCCTLPFNEPWDMGSFSYNNWTLDPEAPNNNWAITINEGYPIPSAAFSGTPSVTSYDESLSTQVLDAMGWTCAYMYLDFDYKLTDNISTGAEKMTVEVSLGNGWTPVMELANNGSVDWKSQHIDISFVKGYSFWVRFRTHGANSSDILSWYLDNIHIYGENYPPTDLTFTLNDQSVTLDWKSPDCQSGNIQMDFIFDDGTFEDGINYNPGVTGWFGNEFPIADQISGILQTIHVYFIDNGTGTPQEFSIDVFDSDKTLMGSSGIFLVDMPNEWIDVDINNLPFAGLFYVMVKWNNLPGNSFFLGMDTNGPYAPSDLEWAYDGTTFTKQSSVYGSPFLFLIRATAMVNGNLKKVLLTPTEMLPEGQAGKNTGKIKLANRKGDSGNHSVMLLNRKSDTSVVAGYNIYRTDNTGEPPFNLINTVSETSYVDTFPTGTGPSVFKYYVTALMKDTMNGYILPGETPSDTITVNYLMGIREKTSNSISLFPNPANDIVNVISTLNIREVEIMNSLGQIVYSFRNNLETGKLQLNVADLIPGFYFVKVTTSQGTRVFKIKVYN